MLQYLYMMMSSWALVCDVWYLPPMNRRSDETAIDFANRVKAVIAKQGGLVDLAWYVIIYATRFVKCELFIDLLQGWRIKTNECQERMETETARGVQQAFESGVKTRINVWLRDIISGHLPLIVCLMLLQLYICPLGFFVDLARKCGQTIKATAKKAFGYFDRLYKVWLFTAEMLHATRGWWSL